MGCNLVQGDAATGRPLGFRTASHAELRHAERLGLEICPFDQDDLEVIGHLARMLDAPPVNCLFVRLIVMPPHHGDAADCCVFKLRYAAS